MLGTATLHITITKHHVAIHYYKYSLSQFEREIMTTVHSPLPPLPPPVVVGHLWQLRTCRLVSKPLEIRFKKSTCCRRAKLSCLLLSMLDFNKPPRCCVYLPWASSRSTYIISITKTEEKVRFVFGTISVLSSIPGGVPLLLVSFWPRINLGQFKLKIKITTSSHFHDGKNDAL